MPDDDPQLAEAKKAFNDLVRLMGELKVTSRAQLTEREQWVLTGSLVRMKRALGISGPMVTSSGTIARGGPAIAVAPEAPRAAQERHARWHLTEAGPLDRQIESRLVAGLPPREIAESVGCASAYVEEIARERLSVLSLPDSAA